MAHTPLTHSQMMIWMGQQIDPKIPLYNMVLCFEFSGAIAVELFEKAFQRLIETNDVLRMHIEVNDGLPQLVFGKSVKNPLQYIDLSKYENPEENFSKWVEADKVKPFQNGELLFRPALLKLSPELFVFYINQHHLVTDGWAMKHLYDELNAFYQRELQANVNQDAIIYSFEDYARRNPFKYDNEISMFWKDKSQRIPPSPLLYGGKNPLGQSHSTRVNIGLGKERTRKLLAFANEGDIKALTKELTLSNIFLTVLGTLLYKVGNQEDFSLGMAHHNRLSPKDKKTMGLFMELLPLQLCFSENDSFMDAYQKVQHESFAVFKGMMMSRPDIQSLKSFNALLNFIPVSYADFAGIPMKCDWLLANHVDPNHHIRLQIHDFNRSGEYHLQFDLNKSVFSTEQMEWIGPHFVSILDHFVSNKEVKLEEISIITPEEREKINAWNTTSIKFDESETLLTKFEAQVKDHPNNIALVYGESTLTYSDFDKKVNQVANLLIQKGVGRNQIVAISMERSFEMMIAIYATIKAGAAYLPLDTGTPIKRLEFILESSKAKVFFYDNPDWENLGLNVIDCLAKNTLMDLSGSLAESAPSVELVPGDLAYVIYTSGSTGEPKGVKCHHKGICNRLNWMDRDYPATEDDVFLQKTPITFDVSVWELFWPLQIGARLVIEKPKGHLDPDGLIKTIVQNRVSIVHFVPSMLSIFSAATGVENCISLKRIFCSGEALSVQIVRNMYQKLSAEIHNLYGPTEASVDVTSWYCDKESPTENIPIGFPVANTKIHILDKRLRPVPIGAIGELYISGVQVAQGYLNRQELTQERFLQDNFSKEPDARMYKTGDLARYRQDGAIEYLGRSDTQIKLRGLRIELREIEKSMENIAGIDQAVAKVVTHKSQDNIAAFYIGENILEGQIKEQLNRHLPQYMVPSFFQRVEKFELLSNGKINRKKLPEISLEARSQATHYVGPTNEFEEIIVDIWKEILKIDKIGIDENFIQIGGNSLNAMVITSRLKEAFELELLSMADVFIYPSPRSYGKYVESTLLRLLQEG